MPFLASAAAEQGTGSGEGMPVQAMTGKTGLGLQPVRCVLACLTKARPVRSITEETTMNKNHALLDSTKKIT